MFGSGATRECWSSAARTCRARAPSLRTVGINTVLALAGAPVRATTARITPLAIGATLRIQDSLQEGRFAVLRRDHADPRHRGHRPRSVPLLFLLDELFHGTNSHDRLAGATACPAQPHRPRRDRPHHDARSRTDRSGRRPRPARRQRALRRPVRGGSEIHFDYRMKPGPVTRSNAIALMRAVGLDVEALRPRRTRRSRRSRASTS